MEMDLTVLNVKQVVLIAHNWNAYNATLLI